MPDLSLASQGSWGGYKARPLRFLDANPQHGADVYALQMGLRALGSTVKADGVFGSKCRKAVQDFQQSTALLVDGIAGQNTQREVCDRIGKLVRDRFDLPTGLLYGQMEHESSFWLGNYTPLYTEGDARGSRDLGVVQMNSHFHEPKDALNPLTAIETLADRIKVSYRKYAKVKDEHKRWAYAAGSWNKPAYTDYLAGASGGVRPNPIAEDRIRAYMDAVTAYLR